jgi:hypothetical protein
MSTIPELTIPELWSVPWHELQRRLASSAGSSAAPSGALPLARRPRVMPMVTSAQTLSWLERARAGCPAR